jgi:pimeloyl-ACP methyl ester carboxylesterase
MAGIVLAPTLAMPSAAASVRCALPSIATRAQTRWPVQPPAMTARDGMATLPDVNLWYWDTGGAGETIILLHPFTGSGAVWPWQQAALARAGYRVIGYSRRGFFRSEPGPADKPGTGAGDLADLMDVLAIPRAHLVGCAGGGFVLTDFAVAFPRRVLSLTIANSLGGIVDPDWSRDTERLTPKGFSAMPSDFRELSGSYKLSNPEGARQWLAIEAQSHAGPLVRQGNLRQVDWPAFASIRAPMLVLTGDADIFMPPARARQLAARRPGTELAVLAEAGHAAHWEQPDAFNSTVLEFIGRHRGTRQPGP